LIFKRDFLVSVATPTPRPSWSPKRRRTACSAWPA